MAVAAGDCSLTVHTQASSESGWLLLRDGRSSLLAGGAETTRVPRHYGWLRGLPSMVCLLRPLHDVLFQVCVGDDTSLALSVEGCLAHVVDDGISLPDAEGVRNYLLDHPDACLPLLRICLATIARFAAEADLRLELYRDPEIEDDHLVLYVSRREYDQSFMHALQELWGESEEALEGTTAWILVTTDFGTPG